MEKPAASNPAAALRRILPGWAMFAVGLALLGLLVSVTSATSQAPAHTLYFPFVEDTAPRMLYPENGEVVDTLTPNFRWYHKDIGVWYYSCLAYGTQPHPDCQVLSGFSHYPIDHIPWENLLPGTRYYWRIGSVREISGDNSEVVWWGEEQTFTTPNDSHRLPAAPLPLAPTDGAVIPVNTLKFSWTPVDGAFEYRIWFKNPADPNWYTIFWTPDAGLDISSGEYFPLFQLNTPYEWTVRARNDYGWSADPPARVFRVTE